MDHADHLNFKKTRLDKKNKSKFLLLYVTLYYFIIIVLNTFTKLFT